MDPQTLDVNNLFTAVEWLSVKGGVGVALILISVFKGWLVVGPHHQFVLSRLQRAEERNDRYDRLLEASTSLAERVVARS